MIIEERMLWQKERWLCWCGVVGLLVLIARVNWYLFGCDGRLFKQDMADVEGCGACQWPRARQYNVFSGAV